MLSFFIAAIVLVFLAILFLVLGVGLALIFGIVLVIGIVAAIIGLLFGGDSMLSVVSGLNKGSDVPQQFNTCIIEKKSDECRELWTVWDTSQVELMRAIATQVQVDLGERMDDSSSSRSYSQESLNGQSLVTLDLITDFAKKKAVHEHYVLVNQDSEMKIKELKWVY